MLATSRALGVRCDVQRLILFVGVVVFQKVAAANWASIGHCIGHVLLDGEALSERTHEAR